MNKLREGGRTASQLRPIEITPNFTKWAEGSVLCAFGDTRVLCTASIEDRVPIWLKGQGQGWVTAEYAMLPRATDRRNAREAVQGKIGGRTHEISRLIGRSIRAALDLKRLGERTVTIDCDVLQADGGTRTAAITGGFVALAIGLGRLHKRKTLDNNPIRRPVAAVSLGVVGGEVYLDLSMTEDQRADTDLNLVMNGDGGLIEVQGTAEGEAFSKAELDRMIELGSGGIQELFAFQKAAIEAGLA